MFVRVAYDPGLEFQTHVHQYDWELPDGLVDAAVICKVQRDINRIIGIAVWNGESWRDIFGELPF